MSDYRNKLDYETDRDADPVDADRELARFLLRYGRRNDGETTPTPIEAEDPEQSSSKKGGSMQLDKIADSIRRATDRLNTQYNAWLKTVGEKLLEAQESLAQPGSHTSRFTRWAEKELGWQKAQVYRVINAYETQRLLSPNGDGRLPENEAQYRALACLPEEDVGPVWASVVSSQPRITAKAIERAAQDHEQEEQDVEDGIIEREHQHDSEDGVTIEEIAADEIEDDREEDAEDRDAVIEQQMSTAARTLSKKEKKTQLLIDDLRSRVSLLLDQRIFWIREHGPSPQLFSDLCQNGDSAEVEELATHLTTVSEWTETVARLLRGDIPVN